MFYIAGISISLFLFLALVFKKNKSTADRILACWMALSAVHQMLFYLGYVGIDFKYPFLLGLCFPIPVLYPAMLFLYGGEITGQKPFRWKSSWLHFLPFFALIVLAIPFYTLSGEEKRIAFENHGRGYEWYMYLQNSFFILGAFGYAAWLWFLIRKSRREMEDFYSNTEKRRLDWLQYLSFGLCIISVLVILFDDRTVFAGVVLMMFFAGVYGINQTSIFQSNTHSAANKPLAEETNPAEYNRYAKSGLKANEADQLYERLQQQIQQQAPYRNPDLTLGDLAKSLNIHPNYLSQVINEREGKNFYNYVNALRVEEFLRLYSLPENRRFTLLALAFDCGFNSKSTFNKYFKLQTGMTPSEYFELESV